ncbi:RNA-directed DNA polymerase-like protein [Gossypium australe]|uniref:RNA-directed DNA polymerase-like protein n=1 Tax=Gossypium australe TaxID=47621 RepID=A0A5B6VZH5_9ROSI|nr:RNA-directed DNA polymerase-like protein [Gossypium australe]
MKDVVKKKTIKWLDAVVENENNELIPTRTVTSWRIDYQKLNKETRKDHFASSFLGQMLDRLVRLDYYYFLHGYLGYNQITIASENQLKTTFTCPYGTFAFRHMYFGLRNAPTTSQICMMTIYTHMVEKF